MGEDGKVGMSVYDTATDAEASFRRRYREKTGNTWGDADATAEARLAAFKKHPGKYQLIPATWLGTNLVPCVQPPLGRRFQF